MLQQFIGYLGMFLILTAFIMEQFHKWKDNSLIFGLTNFTGALLMSIYAIIIKSIPFLVLNVVWMIVSLRDIAKYH